MDELEKKPEENKEEIAEETKEAAHKKKCKKPDPVSAIIRIIVVAFFFVALGMLTNTIYGYVNDIEINKNIRDAVIDESPEELVSERPDRETPAYPGIMTPSITYPKIITLEKLQSLKAQNDEFNLWFYIEGTDINYPVMYSGDNAYYLKRDFNKKSNVGGTLFLDYRNQEIKGNVIIYGHNMRNGTMFGELRNYNDEVFFRQHTMIYTYSENEIIAWKIFSAYPTNIFNNYIKTAFVNDAAYLEFLQKLQGDSLFTTDVELNANDTILTLSTCRDGEGSNGRFVVHAVKVQSFPQS